MIAMEKLISLWPVRKANSALFHWRRNAWRRHPAFRRGISDIDADAPKIDRPIFLLGTQNGGLTLLSRILHRHPDAISVSGDHRYWAGEDEAQDALADILPEEFGWRRVDLDGYPTGKHSWIYGSNAFLPFYRCPSAENMADAARRYRWVLRAILRQHGRGRSVRFIDKSQSLTLRVGAVQEVLAESDPRFVVISRDPYAVIWSQATRNGVIKSLDLSMETKVQLCAEHWVNSFSAAFEDSSRNPDLRLRHWRFEDILAQPEETLFEICAFTELDWRPEILPGPKDNIPWGSRIDAFNRRKWYPLRVDVNERYLEALPDWAEDIIFNLCGSLGMSLGYPRPSIRR